MAHVGAHTVTIFINYLDKLPTKKILLSFFFNFFNGERKRRKVEIRIYKKATSEASPVLPPIYIPFFKKNIYIYKNSRSTFETTNTKKPRHAG